METIQVAESLLQRKRMRRERIVWDAKLHQQFLDAIENLKSRNYKICPSKILEEMNDPNLTRDHVASHLQKYSAKKTGKKAATNESGGAEECRNEGFFFGASSGEQELPPPNRKEHEMENEKKMKKERITWSSELHQKFLDALHRLVESQNKICPSNILELMNEPTLTRNNVASHLQKYREVKAGRAAMTANYQQFGLQSRDQNSRQLISSSYIDSDLLQSSRRQDNISLPSDSNTINAGHACYSFPSQGNLQTAVLYQLESATSNCNAANEDDHESSLEEDEELQALLAQFYYEPIDAGSCNASSF